MKNYFKVNNISDLKNLELWFKEQVVSKRDKHKMIDLFEPFVVEFKEMKKWKSNQQNRTFWALIDCFSKSSCGSFHSYSEMVEYYYRIAGLITIKTKSTLEKSTKLKLYKVIEANSFHDWEKKAIYKLLKGEYEKHLSWSRVKKDKATLTIDCLLKDMNEAQVIGSKMGKKYEEILNGMEER